MHGREITMASWSKYGRKGKKRGPRESVIIARLILFYSEFRPY
jgi:hypothetical protein